MYAKRGANCVAEFAVLDPVLTREDLDAFLDTAVFDRDSEPKCEVIDIDPAFGSQERFGGEEPQMPAAAGLLKLSGVNYSFRSTTTIIPDSCWNFLLSSPC